MRKTSIMAVILAVSLMVTGCGKGDSGSNEIEQLRANNEELISMCEEYIDSNNSLSTENDELKDRVESLIEMIRYYDEDSSALAEYGASVMLSDGTKAKLALDGMISIGSSIELTSLVESDNKNAVAIGKNIGINPSENWTMKFIKNGIQLQHADGICSEINVRQGMFSDTANEMYDKYVKKFIDEIEAETIEKRTLFTDGAVVGYTTRASVNVIDGQVILDWEKFINKDAEANNKIDEAKTAESELEALEKELEMMKSSNEEYNAAIIKNEELAKENAEIEERNKEALDKDANASVEELKSLIDIKTIRLYTDDEIEAKEAEIDAKSGEAKSIRGEANKIRNSTPSPDLAEKYCMEIGLLNDGGTACYYYILYKKVNYASVSETIDALIKGIKLNGVAISIS